MAQIFQRVSWYKLNVHILACVLLPFTLMACSSAPVLLGPTEPIEEAQLADYWLAPAAFQTEILLAGGSLDCKALSPSDDASGPYATFNFLIDAKGKVYDRKFISKSDDLELTLDQLDKLAELMSIISNPTYKPAESNIAKVPVRVTSRMYLQPARDCEKIKASLQQPQR